MQPSVSVMPARTTLFSEPSSTQPRPSQFQTLCTPRSSLPTPRSGSVRLKKQAIPTRSILYSCQDWRTVKELICSLELFQRYLHSSAMSTLLLAEMVREWGSYRHLCKSTIFMGRLSYLEDCLMIKSEMSYVEATSS